ncbi:MAG: energy transducer TonB [bacterium]|nr:energy transducer TonB [bacterium]
MENRFEIKILLLLLISLFIHAVLFTVLVLPKKPGMLSMLAMEEEMRDRFKKLGGRDIIVNINQDKKRVYTQKTLLSDKDSSAKGYITKTKGDRWLNNSRDFVLLKGSRSSSGKGTAKSSSNARAKKKKMILSDESEIVVQIERELPRMSAQGQKGIADRILIPDKNDVTMKNSIYYSSNGMFSFNTAKFKNFKYFKSMKDNIASHWYPPIMANAVFGGYNPATGGYAPGRVRIMAIPSQRVKLYFTMNRNGDILDVKILDSYGNRALDASCLDAVRLSKNFGKVPDDIKGKVIVIPFIFGYYTY